MRNNGKTSMIDYRGYILSFDVILFPMVRSLASHDRHMVYFEGGGDFGIEVAATTSSSDGGGTRVAARAWF
jgi:hypothetical protein